MSRFNLIDEKWIPVRFPDATRDELGIRDTLLRSKAIGLDRASNQPKKGIHNNSRLATQACGGNTNCKDSVSHADWCLLNTTHACSGMLSRPRTSMRMPQITFSNHRMPGAKPDSRR